jgi:hypothetical protein
MPVAGTTLRNTVSPLGPTSVHIRIESGAVAHDHEQRANEPARKAYEPEKRSQRMKISSFRCFQFRCRSKDTRVRQRWHVPPRERAGTRRGRGSPLAH